MAQMSDFELSAILDEAVSDAVIHNGEFSRDNELFLKYYNKDLIIDPGEGRSKAQSSDVADIVDADMTSLVRVFLGSNEIIKFSPKTDSPEDIKEAEQKTKYADWIIRGQVDSYKTNFSFMKDAEIQSMGVVKYFMEDTTKTEEHSYKGLSLVEAQQVQESFQGSDIRSVDIVESTENEDTTVDIKFRVTSGEQCVKIINVPTESFLISRNAYTLESAQLVGDRVRKTRSELIAEGYSRKLVERLPEMDTDRNSNLKAIRFKDEGGEDYDTGVRDWSTQEVEIEDLYVLVDYDGDGIAERRHILKSGREILENEVYNHVPYAMMSAIPMPNKAIGMGRAELVMETQDINTQLIRGMLDNIYMSNNGRNVVSDDVNIDDLLTVRPGGIVRTDGDPTRSVIPLVTEYTGDKTLQVLQHMDQRRAQRTGSLLASQGLDADKMGKETATRFQGIQDAAIAKVELIARNFAEIGFKKLYEGVIWTVTQFQTTKKEIRVLGEEFTIDPGSWKYNHKAETQVGLGAGGNDKISQSMTAIYTIQNQLKETGSSLVDSEKIYNSLKNLLKSLDLPNTADFFNDPNRPEQLILAENEIMKQTVEQLTMQLQQAQNPLAEAELIKREGQIAIQTAKVELEQQRVNIEKARLLEQQRQFDLNYQKDQAEKQVDTALDLTKMELDSNKNVPGALV
jgi:hypothetical protein